MAETTETGSPFARETLCQALQETLEGALGTILAKPVALWTVAEGSALRIDVGGIFAHVARRGEREGTFSLVLNPNAAHALAAPLLMADEPSLLDQPEVPDAIGECANIVAGGLKARVFDPHGAWALGTPDCAFQSALCQIQHEGMLAFDLDGDILSVGVSWSIQRVSE